VHFIILYTKSPEPERSSVRGCGEDSNPLQLVCSPGSHTCDPALFLQGLAVCAAPPPELIGHMRNDLSACSTGGRSSDNPQSRIVHRNRHTRCAVHHRLGSATPLGRRRNRHQYIHRRRQACFNCRAERDAVYDEVNLIGAPVINRKPSLDVGEVLAPDHEEDDKHEELFHFILPCSRYGRLKDGACPPPESPPWFLGVYSHNMCTPRSQDSDLPACIPSRESESVDSSR
jgi:hypothetical protein